MRRSRRFFSSRQNILGVGLVIFFLFIAIAAPVLAPPEDPTSPSSFKVVGRVSDMQPHPPSANAWLGTNSEQEDVFYTLVWGTRDALKFGLLVTIVTASSGILFGAFSAYFGSLTNNLMMRLSDAFLAFPVIAGVVLFRQLLVILRNAAGIQIDFYGFANYTAGPAPPLLNFLTRLNPVMIALVLLGWVSYARLTNALVLQLKGLDYVSAARALGSGHSRLILRHLLPNSLSPSMVLAARDLGSVVILQATFTFIGLGGGSPWGELLSRGRDWIIGPGGNPFTYWWVYLPATLALILFGLGWNMLGDGLNDFINPRKH